ncbi:hypothetical protein COV17_01215 [Candidatus Woesearchaeota archaeon CG10_big_fil_rev_8_21_14_0_10_36_11]|nr:MAG: hypothetical protein COV17_01215 [Candidatus Woesearchaeota archaeon CG10_big_fil_rev_8_21_14_0_10_36_11]
MKKIGIEDLPVIDKTEITRKSDRAREVRASLRIVGVYTVKEHNEILRERAASVAAIRIEQGVGTMADAEVLSYATEEHYKP